MAHTPGPWFWRRGQIILNGSNVYQVNEICSPQGGSNPDDIRLMAAAPDMLSCLRASLAALEELDAGWRDMDATLVDQVVATNLHAIRGVLQQAAGHVGIREAMT